MTEKELRKLNRVELLEMLVTEMKEVERLEETVTALQQQLADRTIIADNAGSIAEASLRLNGVFCAAQAAADQYLENIRKTESNCRRIVEEARAKADQIITAAKGEAAGIEARAKEWSSNYWAETMKMMECFYRDHEELKATLAIDKKVTSHAETTHNRTIGSESDRERIKAREAQAPLSSDAAQHDLCVDCGGSSCRTDSHHFSSGAAYLRHFHDTDGQ